MRIRHLISCIAAKTGAYPRYKGRYSTAVRSPSSSYFDFLEPRLLLSAIPAIQSLGANSASAATRLHVINTTEDDSLGLESVNGLALFTASDPIHGLELWKSDGTAAGTTLLKDINPGPESSQLAEFQVVNGVLFFQADDGVHGAELWRSNGNAAGTFMVKDINADEGSYPTMLDAAGGTLYFEADDGDGNELWVTDGTQAGTCMVAAINPDGELGIGSSTVLNGILYFSADDGTNGEELWRSNGTAAGTFMVKDINPGDGSYPDDLFGANGILYFEADDGIHGIELWRSNGTAAGTTLLKDINPGLADSCPSFSMGDDATLGDSFYFTADDGVHGDELWKSDGTAIGTSLLEDIHPGSQGADWTGNDSPGFTIINHNGTLFIFADDGVHGESLWKSNGTAAGTVWAKTLDACSDLLERPRALVQGDLYIDASDGMQGEELWRIDGTTAIASIVQDINPGADGSCPQYLTEVTGDLFFFADDGTNGPALWILAASAPVSPKVDLKITNTNGVTSVVAGMPITYTIVVSNSGPSTATGAKVTDTFPTTLTGLTYTAVQTGGATGFVASGTGNLSQTVTLPPGSTITYTVKGTVSPSATGTLVNTATVAAAAGTTDTSATNDSASDSDTLTKKVDLKITNTNGATSVVAGMPITYTIVVSNSGPSTATGAKVTDTFPATLTGLTYTAVQTGGATGFVASGTGNLSQTVTLPPGSTITYTVKGTVSPSATGTLVNTATVAAAAGTTDTSATNDSASNVINLVTAPATPTKVTLSNIWTSQADISWQSSNVNTASFLIQFSKDGTNWSNCVSGISSSARSYRVSGLAPVTHYYFRVRGVNGAGVASGVDAPVNGWTAPLAPKDVKVTDYWSTIVRLSWTSQGSGVQGFIVERSLDGSAWHEVKRVGATVTAAELDGCTPNTHYWFRVRSYGSTGSRSGGSNVINLITAPATPTKVTLSNIWTSQADISWQSSDANTASFLIQFSKDGTNWSNCVSGIPSSARSYRVSGLAPVTHYYFRVRGVNGAGVASGVDAPVNGWTAPLAPKDVKAPDYWSTIVRLSWTPQGSGIQGFIVERSTDNAQWQIVQQVSASTTTAELDDCTPSTHYWFRVRSYGSTGTKSDSSNVWELITAPATPTQVTLSNIWTSQADISWQSSDANTASFLIQFSKDGTNWSNCVSGISSSARSYHVSGLDPVTHYYFRVRGVNGAGVASGVDAPANGWTAPLAPKDVKVPDYWSTIVRLSWTSQGSGVQGFIVERSLDGSAWHEVQRVGATVTVAELDDCTPSTHYWFRVRSYGSTGTKSDSSNVVGLITAPAAPKSLKLVSLGSTYMDISWACSDLAVTGFLIQYSSNNGASWSDGPRFSATDRSGHLSGLKSKTKYLVRVRSIGANDVKSNWDKGDLTQVIDCQTK